jgi:ADP-dependent NAD(P)H-hydrate dehydratase / NAD(P)H-hydrate epimerase
MYIVTAEEMYELDRHAIEQGGMSGQLLMENAGRSIAERIIQSECKTNSIAILVGSGNNGGDGFVIARYLMQAGFSIHVFQVVPNEKINGDALFHKQLFLLQNGVCSFMESPEEFIKELEPFDVIVDAMLGIGVKGKVRSPMKEIIASINQWSKKVIALDIPSGLPADEQTALDISVKATKTYVVEAPKQSLFTEWGAPYYGEWEVVSIGIPSISYQSNSYVKKWTKEDIASTLPRRDRFAHKGTHGKGLLIGGHKMPGSVVLATKAALRSGAGLITVATENDTIPIIASHCIEAMYEQWNHFITDRNNLQRFDAIAMGMGVGKESFLKDMMNHLLEQKEIPIIVDADGLTHLKPLLPIREERIAPVILTPHFGEIAMLSGKTISEWKRSPFFLAKQYAMTNNVYIVLKGKFTIITCPDGTQYVSDTGNAGLAKGGSGDVLAGIMLSMIMQNQSITEAICNACYIHGKSAELLVESGQHTEYDLLASDVIDGLSQVFRTIF